MMKFKLILILLFLSSCGYNNTKLPGGTNAGAGPGEINQGVSGWSFQKIKSEVFDPQCTRCHSQAGGNRGRVNLETYANVKPILTVIKTSIDNGLMPPIGTVPQAAQTLLNNWIAAGAPEFGSNSDATTPTAPVDSPPQAEVPTRPPMNCEEHQHLIQAGHILEVDQHYFFEMFSGVLKKRNDDCPKVSK